MSHPGAPADHASVAWLLTGIANTPGTLSLHQGRLRFHGDDGLLFDEPLWSVDVTFPWYYFSGGLKITAAGRRHRISLTRPNGAPSPARAGADLAGLELLSAAGSIGDLVRGRREGRTWRTLLTSEKPAGARPDRGAP